MFINFWYPAELASAVTTNPVRVKLLGQNFVVFRDAQGTQHHVIPSPARRHSASWVFPPVPLLARGA